MPASIPNPSWLDSGFLLQDWEVRPRHGTVSRRGEAGSEPVHVEPRVMAVLLCLARRAGEVVTRDEFSAEVWSGRVVSDEALSRCISLLRQVLADDSREPHFIRTIARIGYTLVPTPLRLAPTVPEVAGASSQGSPDPSIDGEGAGTAPPPVAVAGLGRAWSSRRFRFMLLALGAIGLIVALAFVYSARGVRSADDIPPSPVSRLLVLPFDTGDAKGFTRDVGVELAGEIADSLSHVERLQVSGRTSADTLGAAHTSALEAGRKLGVDAVLSGSVAEQPGGLRVSVKLTATNDGRLLWSRDYARQEADIFAVQSSIASAVVRELIGLLNPTGLTGVPSVEPESRDLEAYRLYLRGAHQFRLRGEDSLRLAIDLFSSAIRRDPTYVRALVGLASAYALLPGYSYENPTEMYGLADKALARADQLSQNHSITAGTRAYIDFMRGHWVEAETAFRSAIVADPNNPEVRQMYSQLLGAVGRLDAALVQARLAQDIDPLAPVVADRLGLIYLWQGRDAEAASNMAMARELGLDEVAYPETRILLKLHQHEDAAAEEDIRTLQSTLVRSKDWIAPALDAYRHPEKRPAAMEIVDATLAAGGISARIYFGIMVLLESPARALRGYAALPDGGGNDLEFLFSVDAAAVRRDPAFGEFIRRIGVEADWKRFGWPSACHSEAARIVCH